MDELDEEPDESHDCESDRRRCGDLLEFWKVEGGLDADADDNLLLAVLVATR